MSRASNDEEASSAGFQSLVRAVREEMQRARSQYYQEKIWRHSVSKPVRVQLARAALNYYDVLWEFRSKNQEIRKAWEQSDVDAIQRLSNETVAVPTNAPGRSSATQTTEQNALLAIDPDRLVALTKKLDFFANRLGFGAEVTTDRPKGRIGGDERYEDNEDDGEDGDENEAGAEVPEDE